MLLKLKIVPLILIVFGLQLHAQNVHSDGRYAEAKEVMQKANGFKGIWYMNQPSNDEYVYKYSGGLATYCAKHQPFGVYSKKVDKTFFCFGGTDNENSTLLHCVSYFDHKTGKVANPTIVIDKQTIDAHDNPVISMDDKGYIWLFSNSHGIARPSYIYKSTQAYSIDKFEQVKATILVDGKEEPFDNFSYFQVWHIKNKGFFAFYTKYQKSFGSRYTGFNFSKDGVHWGEFQLIGAVDEGHYQISGNFKNKIAVAFNYHPKGKGLNYRTNLYYIESNNFGKTWTTAEGQKVNLPFTHPENPAKVYDFESEGLNCYMKDLNYDKKGNPIAMVVSSKGHQSGPENNPRTWGIFHYKNGWQQKKVTTSDNNYDTGSIYINSNKSWTVIAPTETGQQPYNPGGEIAIWKSEDEGTSWKKEKQMTRDSERNHGYVRRPVNAQNDFYGIWADGHGRKPSESYLYFCDSEGNVFQLPRKTEEAFITPVKIFNKQ